MKTYLHNQLKPGVGKIGSVVLLETKDQVSSINSELEVIGGQLAMHAAAMKPVWLHDSDISDEIKAQLKEEGLQQALLKVKEGMNEKAKEKMLAGVAEKALTKVVKRDVFMKQELATNEDSMTVEKFIAAKEKEHGHGFKIGDWALF